MPRNITVTFEDGSKHVYAGAPDDITPEAVQARAAQEFGKTVKHLDGGRKENALVEGGRVLDKVLRKGAAALPGFMGDIGALAMGKSGEIGPQHGLAGIPSMLMGGMAAAGGHDGSNPYAGLKFGDVTKTIETVGGALPPVSEPQTSAGKAIANIAEPAVSTALGGGAGSMTNKILTGLAAGGGGELATRIFGDNALTRFLGGLAGGVGAGAVQAFKPNSENIIRTATEQMNDLDWKKAEALKKVLSANDIPHANSQLLGPRSTLDDVVNTAATNPRVKPKFATAVPEDKVNAKSRQALENFTSRNLPINVNERRDVLQDVQDAAQQVITTRKQGANNAYKANMPPEGEHYDKDHILSLRQQLLDLAESDRFGRGTDSHGFITRVAERLMRGGNQLDDLTGQAVAEPVTSKHVVNNIIKELNQMAEKEGYKGLAINDIKMLMKGFTPEFDDARAAKTAFTNREVYPVQQGLTGKIAQMGGGIDPAKHTATDTALTIVFPKNNPQPQAILALEKQMGGDAVGQLLREHLARQMQEATALSGKGPASFVTAIAGTNAQRQNLNAALEATARANGVDPAPVRKGFYQLMKAFDSFKDLKLPKEVDRAALAQEAGKNIVGTAVAPHSRLGRLFWERATAKTYNEIADIVLAPDGLTKLREIAQSKSPEIARQAAIAILTTTMQSAPEAAQPNSPGIIPE